MIPFNVKQIKSLITFWGNKPSICFLSSILLERSKDLKTCFSVYFSKAFPKGEYATEACSNISL